MFEETWILQRAEVYMYQIACLITLIRGAFVLETLYFELRCVRVINLSVYNVLLCLLREYCHVCLSSCEPIKKIAEYGESLVKPQRARYLSLPHIE